MITATALHTADFHGYPIRFLHAPSLLGGEAVVYVTGDLRHAVSSTSRYIPQIVELNERYFGIRERLILAGEAPVLVASASELDGLLTHFECIELVTADDARLLRDFAARAHELAAAAENGNQAAPKAA